MNKLKQKRIKRQPLVEKHCLLCNKLFKTQVSYIKRGGGKLCSKKCMRQWVIGRKMSEKDKLKISISKKGTMVGYRNPQWLGGKSFEPYTVDWTETLREAIRERDKRVCRICFTKEKNRKHSVHHIDYKKTNCNPSNLITLCVNCHTKTNLKRDYWIKYFKQFDH